MLWQLYGSSLVRLLWPRSHHQSESICLALLECVPANIDVIFMVRKIERNLEPYMTLMTKIK